MFGYISWICVSYMLLTIVIKEWTECVINLVGMGRTGKKCNGRHGENWDMTSYSSPY